MSYNDEYDAEATPLIYYNHILKLAAEKEVSTVWEKIFASLDFRSLLNFNCAYRNNDDPASRRVIAALEHYVGYVIRLDYKDWTSLYKMTQVVVNASNIDKVMQNTVTEKLLRHLDRLHLLGFYQQHPTGKLGENVLQHVGNLLQDSDFIFTSTDSNCRFDYHYIENFSTLLQRSTHLRFIVDEQYEDKTAINHIRGIIFTLWKETVWNRRGQHDREITIEDERTVVDRNASASLYYFPLLNVIELCRLCRVTRLTLDCYLVNHMEAVWFSRHFRSADYFQHQITIRYNGQKVLPAARDSFNQFINILQNHQYVTVEQF